MVNNSRPEIPGGRRAESTGRSVAGLGALIALVAAIGMTTGLLPAVAVRLQALAQPAAVAAANGPGLTASAATTGGADVAAGRNLYLATCAACHGDQAQGNQFGPSIQDSGPALNDFMMRTGRMPLAHPDAAIQRGQPVLAPDQIAAVLAWLSTVGSGPAIPDVATSGADLALGRRLFIANCAACHGAGGAGGAVGNGIIAPALTHSTPLDVGEAVVSGPPPMPPFSFAPDELNAIARYVQELQHPASPGGISLSGLGPVPEGLIAGLVGLVALLVVARWIGAAPRDAREIPLPKQAQPFDDADPTGRNA